MSLISLLPLLALCGMAIGGVLEANSYIDRVVYVSLPSQMYGLDPLKLSAFEYEFKDKVKIIGTVKGKATYDEGEMRGLAKVSRRGDCTAPRQFGQYVDIDCTLAFEHIEANYPGHLKYGVLPTKGIKAKGTFSPILADLTVRNDTSRPHTAPYASRLTVKQMGEVRAEFTGLGPLNRYLSILRENFVGRVSGEFVNAFPQFHAAVNRSLALAGSMPSH